jgi:hypothetical protein
MKKILNSGLVLSLLVVGSLSAFAQNLLYVTDSSGKLGTVNLTTHAVTVLGTSGVVLRDIGFTSNGNLYGVTPTSFYSVSTVNGALGPAISMGGAGGSSITSLVGDGTGLIAGSFVTDNLYAIDVSPFSITALTGSLPHPTNGDLTFGNNGAIYDVLTNGDLDKITVSGSSFTSTFLFNTGNTKISGLATGANGTLYAINNATQIYTIDLNTDALVPFFNWSGTQLGNATGAAIASVPEPRNVALLLAGLAVLFFYQKRRGLANLG